MKLHYTLKIYIFFTFLLSAQLMQAQSDSYYLIGLKGGVNVANLQGSEGSTLTGFTGGLYAEYLISPVFTLRSEALYSLQGNRNDLLSDRIKLHYLNWPILGKVYVSDMLGLEFGPQIGFLLSGTGGTLPSGAYNAVDFGLAFGTSVNVVSNLDIGVRYNLGLTEVTKTHQNIKNSVFQFTLGYTLGY